MKKQKPNYKMLLAVGVFMLGVGMLISPLSKAAGFGENENWAFETPGSKAIKLQRLHMSNLIKGGYYQGSHAARNYTGAITINSAMFGNYQQSTNIKNWNEMEITGDNNTLNVDQGGDTTQDADNTLNAGGGQ